MMAKEIPRAFGSLVGNAMTEAIVPKYKLEVASKGSNKTMKKAISDKHLSFVLLRDQSYVPAFVQCSVHCELPQLVQGVA